MWRKVARDACACAAPPPSLEDRPPVLAPGWRPGDEVDQVDYGLTEPRRLAPRWLSCARSMAPSKVAPGRYILGAVGGAGTPLGVPALIIAGRQDTCAGYNQARALGAYGNNVSLRRAGRVGYAELCKPGLANREYRTSRLLSRGRSGPRGNKGAGNRHPIFRGARKFRIIGRRRAGRNGHNRQMRAKCRA